ncbi:YhcN/YlaJ family sporulation lipoprotein [Virgibacillus sp. YIM 98842]|jgi:hypothetical protein|uniref:YhcN/YlaJ family sporulation lipoprotein n=1 Tax=Virgibacillus sp. YIM 98842 TaxID=2663533 RepID=UPI0013DC181B|nr:YhcN/YlaJ family sporulation lipoprotein [Virgibacillus sp. YIM 98842]
MPVKRWLLIASMIAVIAGCNTDDSVLEPAGSPNNDIELMKISKDHQLDQHISNQAKDSMRKYAEVTAAKAVNTDKKMLMAVEVKHNERFNLANIKKQLKKEMEEQFPHITVEFSTDKKIILELDRLEKEIQKDIAYSPKKLEKELDKLISLSKEQT